MVEKPRLTVARWRGSGAPRIRYRLRKCPVQKTTMKNKMGSEYPAWRVAAAPPWRKERNMGSTVDPPGSRTFWVGQKSPHPL